MRDPDMQAFFDELAAVIRRVSPATHAMLRPGFPPELAEEKLSKIPSKSPVMPSLYIVGRMAPMVAFELLPGAYFIPLEDALCEFEVSHNIRDEMPGDLLPALY